jgi:hypothetical protein
MTLTSKSIRSICFLFANSNPPALHNLIFMPRWFVLSSWGIDRWCQRGDPRTRLAGLLVTGEWFTVSVSLLWGPSLAFMVHSLAFLRHHWLLAFGTHPKLNWKCWKQLEREQSEVESAENLSAFFPKALLH